MCHPSDSQGAAPEPDLPRSRDTATRHIRRLDSERMDTQLHRTPRHEAERLASDLPNNRLGRARPSNRDRLLEDRAVARTH